MHGYGEVDWESVDGFLTFPVILISTVPLEQSLRRNLRKDDSNAALLANSLQVGRLRVIILYYKASPMASGRSTVTTVVLQRSLSCTTAHNPPLRSRHAVYDQALQGKQGLDSGGQTCIPVRETPSGPALASLPRADRPQRQNNNVILTSSPHGTEF